MNIMVFAIFLCMLILSVMNSLVWFVFATKCCKVGFWGLTIANR